MLENWSSQTKADDTDQSEKSSCRSPRARVGSPEQAWKSWVLCCVPAALWVQRQEDPWGLLSRQDHYIVTLQVPWETLSQKLGHRVTEDTWHQLLAYIYTQVTHTHVYTCTTLHILRCTHTCTYIHMCTHTHKYTHVCTHTHVYTDSGVHIHTCALILSYIHTCTHAHITYRQVHMYTCTLNINRQTHM